MLARSDDRFRTRRQGRYRFLGIDQHHFAVVSPSIDHGVRFDQRAHGQCFVDHRFEFAAGKQRQRELTETANRFGNESHT